MKSSDSRLKLGELKFHFGKKHKVHKSWSLPIQSKLISSGNFQEGQVPKVRVDEE